MAESAHPHAASSRSTSALTDRRAPRPSRSRRLAWFAPFAVIGIAQIVSNGLDLQPLDTVTAWLAVPALALAAWRLAPRRDAIASRMLLVALALSWIGDVAIRFSFELGLAAFLLALVTYLALSVRTFRRRIRWGAIAYVPLLIAGMVVLVPLADALIVPVFTYAFVLTGMAIAMTRGNGLTTLGGALFFASDAVLALARFGALDVAHQLTDVVIMTTYLGAQLALVLGVHRLLDRRTAPSEVDELTAGDDAYSRAGSRRGRTPA